MSIYEMYGTDKEKEENGIWIHYGKDISFKVARASKVNAKYGKALERLMKPYQKQIRLNTLSDDVASNVMIEAFCEGILLDWKGVTNKEGEEMKYSKENAIKLMNDLPDLFEDLQEQSNSMTLFKEEELQENAKN
jgi:hypothetical protein